MKCQTGAALDGHTGDPPEGDWQSDLYQSTNQHAALPFTQREEREDFGNLSNKS